MEWSGATAATVRCACRRPIALDFQSIGFAFLYVLRIFVFPYDHQKFSDARFFENFSPCARAAREKHVYTMAPVLTHAYVLINFHNARKL